MAMHRPEIVAAQAPRRLLVLRLPAEIPQGDAYPERLAALVATLRDQHVAAEVIDLPFPMNDFRCLQQDLCYWEAARLLLTPGRIPVAAPLRDVLAPYLDVGREAYTAARRRQQSYRAQFDALAGTCDAILLPAATGAAPRSLTDTGDAVMSRFWTALHVPAISVPFWRSSDGMPL